MADFFAHALLRLPWVKRKVAKLSHRNALLRLKALGFQPATIYDIGAYRGGWTQLASEVFPDAAFILFEANADNAAHLAGRRHFTVALSAQDGEKPLFLPRAGDATGTSLYRENSAHYDAGNLVVRTVATARLGWASLPDRGAQAVEIGQMERRVAGWICCYTSQKEL